MSLPPKTAIQSTETEELLLGSFTPFVHQVELVILKQRVKAHRYHQTAEPIPEK